MSLLHFQMNDDVVVNFCMRNYKKKSKALNRTE